MTLIRSFIFAGGQFLLTVLFSTLSLFLWGFSPKTRFSIMRRWAWVNLRWLELTCGLKYKIEGLDNIPAENGIVLCKHQSAWETLSLQEIFPYQAWVLKRELLRIPFFGWGLASMNPIPIDRGAGRAALKQLLAEGQNRVDDGAWVVIFPEGTRTAPQQPGKYNIGGAMLASQTGKMVVPVAHNAGSYWPKNSILKKSGEITVVIGEPFSAEGLKASEINARVETWIEDTMKRIQPES